jgi:hypothetical protein
MLNGFGGRGSLVLGFAALSAVLGGAGCSSSDSGGGGYCETYASRVHECGAAGPGRISCVDYFDKTEICETGCIRDATCTDLVSQYCGADSPVLVCLKKCDGSKQFTCSDGEVLDVYSRCNGVSQCSDGGDEAGCNGTGSKCRNVDQYVDASKFCDGTKDCSDGSDEEPDCKPGVTCNVGGVKTDLKLYSVCNGVAECDDGSDEPADCAARMCGTM